MKKMEIYQNAKNEIVLVEFSSINSLYEKRQLKNEEVCKYLKTLFDKNISNIYESADKLNLTLEYDDFIINLNEYQSILSNKNLLPLLYTIKTYSDTKSAELSGKVTRKNKYTGQKIIAVVLAALVLYAVSRKKKSDTSLKEEISISDVSDYEYDTETPTEIITTQVKNDNIGIKSIGNDLNENKDQNNEAESIKLKYEDRSETEKAFVTQKKYGELIEKYSKMYGLDPIIVTAIATQERGIHSSEVDKGGAIGLMQVQVSVWDNQYLTAHNFETGKEETEHITLDKLRDVEFNIKTGCMIFQNCLNDMDYNLIAAIQCYNMGYGNMMDILSSYSFENNISIRNALNNSLNNEWLDYRSEVTQGDPSYVEHVLSWIGENINISLKKTDGKINCVNIESVQNTNTK